jgi:DNA-binding PucR family transcriptional regulator
MRRVRASVAARPGCTLAFVIADDARVEEQVALAAANLEPRLAELTGAIYDVIERDVPALRGDLSIRSLLEASVGENVGSATHMLRHGIDTAAVEAPIAALEYGRRLAQRDVPAAALIRAYRIGEARYLRSCINELLRLTSGDHIEGRATQQIVEHVSDYIDRVVEQVLTAYEQARENWVKNRSAVLAMRVRSILHGGSADEQAAQAALGYQLRQMHVGLIVWVDKHATDRDALGQLNGLASALANAVGCQHHPLFVPCDEITAWVWLPLGNWSEAKREALANVMATRGPHVLAALGEPASGIDGFRRTHRQAAGAQDVALAGRPARAQVTSFVEVAPIAMMCTDLDAARAWVIETLGPLATDSERHARLRESARVFLTSGGSYTVTADELFLHRNTAQYRIQKAEELRGRPLREGRLDVELALLACHWLGRAVLLAPPS